MAQFSKEILPFSYFVSLDFRTGELLLLFLSKYNCSMNPCRRKTVFQIRIPFSSLYTGRNIASILSDSPFQTRLSTSATCYIICNCSYSALHQQFQVVHKSVSAFLNKLKQIAIHYIYEPALFSSSFERNLIQTFLHPIRKSHIH